ncbi:MAG TPA: hemolysin family protein [Thermoanaerobaculia bacterium]|nr:hemolysin family protein [Thermoanaerobaculia bacterium]
MALTVVAVIFLLIAVNALYVAAEFAAVSARRSRIALLAEDGDRLARQLLPVVQNPVLLDRYIAACQIGITFSSLVLGAYGQVTLASRLKPLLARLGGMQELAAESAATAIVLILLTTLQMVLGELVPKSVALRFPVRTALYTVVPMRWSLVLFSWFIFILNGTGTAILRLFGVRAPSHRHIHSAEEIELLIVESEDLEPDEHVRLRRALRFGSRPARQLMVPRRSIAAVEVATPLRRVFELVADSPYTRLPVFRDSIDNIIGIIHTKELVRHLLEVGDEGSLEKLVRPVVHVPESATADQLLSQMREERTHQAVVVDEFGGVAGLVTLEDLLTEVLGSVTDEFKIGEPQPERLADGGIRLPGIMRLYEAEPWIGALEEAEAETLGGLVAERLGHLPSEGERIRVDGVEFEVERVEGHFVSSLIVRTVYDPEAPHE